MEKAQKKPIIIEFIQLREDNILEVYTEVFGKPGLSSNIADDKWHDYESIVKRDGLKLKTPESGEGTQIASIGDYIVFGYSEKMGRHCWPVKPDYFENAYDVIPPESVNHVPILLCDIISTEHCYFANKFGCDKCGAVRV